MVTSRSPYLKGQLAFRLVRFFGDDFRRITHALEVLHEAEKLFEATPAEYDAEIVIAAALLHDVGIKPAEDKLGYNDGGTQEQYGPPIAREILAALDFPAEKTEVVCNIIGNHHSPTRHPYPELELLKTADRTVNQREKESPSS